jgi:hypothetical protein
MVQGRGLGLCTFSSGALSDQALILVQEFSPGTSGKKVTMGLYIRDLLLELVSWSGAPGTRGVGLRRILEVASEQPLL